MLGSYIFGWLSDKCGRKLSFFISIIMQVAFFHCFCQKITFIAILFQNYIQTLFGVLSGVVSNYWAFVLLRMVVGQL